jgi:hypothetical protein
MQYLTAVLKSPVSEHRGHCLTGVVSNTFTLLSAIFDIRFIRDHFLKTDTIIFIGIV